MSTRLSRRRWLAVALMVVAAAPLLLAIVKILRQPYFPVGDQAVIELRVRDVGPHTPLVGPYSRYYWNHPGPMLYAFLAVPYRVLGARSTSLLGASGVLNLLSVAGLGIVAWRRGRLALVALTALGVAVLVEHLGPAYLENPWNPYLTLLPVALFVFLAWTIVEGDIWATPVAVLVGSFLVESHIGYALLVFAVGAAATVEILSRRWRHLRFEITHQPEPGPGRHDPVDGRWRRVLLTSGVVAAVLWLPVAIDEIWGTHNLSTLVSYFTKSEHTPVGFGSALGFMAREFGGGPPHLFANAPWLGGPEAVDPGSGSVVTDSAGALVFPAACFAVAAVAAWRTRARAALRLQGLVLVAVGATYLSLARITDTVYNYLIRWTWVLAMVFWIAIGWSLWSTLTRVPWPDRLASALQVARRAAPWVVLVGLVWIGATTVRLDEPLPEAWAQPTMATLAGPTIAAAPDGGVIRVRGVGGFVNSVTDGLSLQLERAGHPVAVEPIDAYKFGEHRTTDVAPSVATMWVVYADAINEYRAKPDLREVAQWDPLSPEERAQYAIDDQTLGTQLRAAHRDDLAQALAMGDSIFPARTITGVDQHALRRYEQARDKGLPVAVFFGPPT